MPNFFSSISEIIVLMVENRSFHHMLGFLCAEENNPAKWTGF
jgi:phospholipase C